MKNKLLVNVLMSMNQKQEIQSTLLINLHLFICYHHGP